jgi:hypothetical protein
VSPPQTPKRSSSPLMVDGIEVAGQCAVARSASLAPVRAENSIQGLKQPARTHEPDLRVGRVVEGGGGQQGSLGALRSSAEASAGRGQFCA